MSTGAWQAGFVKSISFNGVVLKIKSSSWDEQIQKLVVTHSQSGGVEGWIAGILSAEGEVEANIDASLMPAGFGIYAGAFGTYTFGVGQGAPLIAAVGVTKVHYATAVDGLVTYSFSIALNSEAGQTYQRPG